MTVEPQPRINLGRPNVLEIDLDAIAHNLAVLRSLVGSANVFAALKADAYGFGLLPVAEILSDAGINALAFADLQDAIEVREHGIATPILIYGGPLVDGPAVEAAERYDLAVTATDIDVARAYSDHANSTLSVFAEIDCGDGRFGEPIAQALPFLREITTLRNIELAGIYTHLLVSPTQELEPVHGPRLRRFVAAVEEARSSGIVVPVAMAASTSVLVRTRDYVLDAVDVGHFIYGLAAPASDLKFSHLGLRTALISLTSRLVHCKTIDRGDLPESAPLHLRAGMRIGVVPIGFADGLASWTCGSALVRGRRVPLVGEPSLEHARLDVTDIPDAQPGDEVVFIGRQGNTEITAKEVLVKQRAENAPARLPISIRGSVQRNYRGSRAASDTPRASLA
jgi:alanine racemase